jgi:hypothetical protein
VYAAAVDDVAELQHRVEEGCELIPNTPGIFERVRQSLIRRTARCVQTVGQHFEQFL